MAPVVRALKGFGHHPDVIAFGQHTDLLRSHLAEEKIRPRNVCEIERDSLSGLVAAALHCGEVYLDPERHGLVLVQGDTTTAMAAALAAFHLEILIGHVEAGLRTGNLAAPFPEEANRKIIAQIARLHFAPNHSARMNLHDDGIGYDGRVHVTGNTVVDALKAALKRRPSRIVRTWLRPFQQTHAPYILVTCHRREGWRTYIPALTDLVRKLPTPCVWPAHPNPEIQQALGLKSLHAVPGASGAIGHVDFVHLLKHAALVITDSGGVIEEAAVLGKRTLIVRGETERWEAIEMGGAKLIAPDQLKHLSKEIAAALKARPPKPVYAFGDGKAGERIARICLKFLRS